MIRSLNDDVLCLCDSGFSASVFLVSGGNHRPDASIYTCGWGSGWGSGWGWGRPTGRPTLAFCPSVPSSTALVDHVHVRLLPSRCSALSNTHSVINSTIDL